MDRADAMRLLQALADAGMDIRAPRTNAWIEKKALEIGLEGGQFVSALAYAGSEGWLVDAPRRLDFPDESWRGYCRTLAQFLPSLDVVGRHKLLNCS
jgi:hypothetical protein